MKEKNVLIPYVVERTSAGERSYDLYSRLLDDRIVFLSGEIDDALANTVVAQLIYLEGRNRERIFPCTSILPADRLRQVWRFTIR